MSATEHLRSARQALEEMKGRDIVSLDIRHLSIISDYFLLASGSSERHVRAMAHKLRKTMSAQGLRLIGSEGEEDAEWILLDFGELVVHLMSAAARDFYALERLWAPEVQPVRRSGSRDLP